MPAQHGAQSTTRCEPETVRSPFPWGAATSKPAHVVHAFPWGQLPTFSRAALRARQGLLARFDWDRIAASCEQLLQLKWDAGELLPVSPRGQRPALDPHSCWLCFKGLSVRLQVESALGAAVVSQVVGKQVPLDSGAPLAAGAWGAFLAVVTAAARRLAVAEPPVVQEQPPENVARGADASYEFFVRLSGVAYRGALSVYTSEDAAPLRARNPRLDSSVPLSLVASAAEFSIDAEELSALQPGDVLLPGEGLFAADGAPARYRLYAPGTAVSFMATVVPNGLRFEGRSDVLVEAPAAPSPPSEELSSSSAERAAAEVRISVDVGTVTLPFSRWAQVQPGDALGTLQSLDVPCVLRVLGERVAAGSWVRYRGERGLRIEHVSRAPSNAQSEAAG